MTASSGEADARPLDWRSASPPEYSPSEPVSRLGVLDRGSVPGLKTLGMMRSAAGPAVF